MKRGTGFAASDAQRAKVFEMFCVNCGSTGKSDPAHLTARAQGGCDHPDCVLPLCRSCHRVFDEGQLDLEPVLALSRYAGERAHMASHLTFQQCLRRLNGRAA